MISVMETTMKRILYTAALLLLASAAPTFADEHNGQANIRNHGAKCDGINDDTSAFRQAINDAPFGGIVFVPAGKCVVSETLVINSTHLVSIVGDGVGSQIFQRADKTLLRLTGVNALMIKNLFLGSAATAPGTALIELNNSHHNRIDNVTMLGSSYGLHLYGSLLNTIVDLRSGINFGNLFFADSKVSTNQYWVYAERNPTTNISANANTFIAPALEGGTNGIVLTDTNGQGSLQIVGGTIEGVTGIGLQFQGTFLPSSITGIDFEDNGQDIVINNSSNIRLSAINSVSGFSNNMQKPNIVSLTGDTRNVQISDSSIDSITVAYTTKRIVLQNITFGLASGAYSSVSLTLPPTIIPPNSPTNPFPEPIATITAANVGNYAAGE
jgi:hypothetical protein